MRRPYALLILSCAALVACGGPETEGPREPVRRAALPATDRDPVPYTPPTSTEARTGEVTSLSAAGGEDQARRMLPAFLEAMRDADERALGQLLGEEIGSVRARGRRHAASPRATLVQRIVLHSRRAQLASDTEVEQLVDLERLRVSRASEFWAGREMPRTVLPTDLVLEVPLLEAGRGPLRTLVGWSVRGHLVVRPGRDARIVAM